MKKTKMFALILLALFAALSVIYYSAKFCCDNELIFTSEDKFILFIQALSFIIISCFLIWLVVDRKEIYNILSDIYNQIIEAEDNNVLLHRNTQDMIMRIFDKSRRKDVDE